MGVNHIHAVNYVLILNQGGTTAAAATLLGFVFGKRLILDVACMRQCDNRRYRVNQILLGDFGGIGFNNASSGVTVGVTDFFKLFDNDVAEKLFGTENFKIVLDAGGEFALFLIDLAAFKIGQTVQRHIQNCSGLRIGEVIEAVTDTECGINVFRLAEFPAAGVNLNE